MIESIKGLVLVSIYVNEPSGFGIFKVSFSNSGQKPVTIKGTLADLKMDHTYEFFGNYVEDRNYGLQFQVDSYEMILPTHTDFIVKYLSGPSFPGVGRIIAERIVEKYGELVLDEIKTKTIDHLEVKGLSEKNAMMVVETIQGFNAEDDRVSFLLAHGFSNKQIISINKVYGEASVERIKNNPYDLVAEVDGIGFKRADKIALEMGFEHDAVERRYAFLLDQYQTMVYGNGHSFIYYDDFIQQFSSDYEAVLDQLIEDKLLIDDEGRLYHHTQYTAETHIAEFIGEFVNGVSAYHLDGLEEKIAAVESRLMIEFDPIQKEAIQQFFEEDMLVLTGGPGTGKSTLLSGIITLIQTYHPRANIAMCAPTGRAAKRLEELTNVQASTIHSLLKWDLEANEFGMDADNPLEFDIIIVDEFSMVDLWLLHNLFMASDRVKKFLFVGDKDQIPSVGPGFVLGDLIESGVLPIITLERNYRQEKGSEVVDLALNFNKGILDIEDYSSEVKFYDARYGPVKDIVLKVVSSALDKGYSLNDIQVLAPMYAGSAGIDNLNYFLQQMCNPADESKDQVQVGTKIFRVGDKMLQLKNQADDFVFNGDIGNLIGIDNRTLLVDFSGNVVEYEPSDYINLAHAYCMSVHKAQGSEYPIVVLVATKSFRIMLSRRLYYTGMTRSSKSLILTGEYDAFKIAMDNHEESIRNTYLKERLRNER